jgi:hypothetical protein
MRITKQQLQQIINEEISDVLLRMKNRKLIENVPPGGTMGKNAPGRPASSDEYPELGGKYGDPKPKSTSGVINITMTEKERGALFAAIKAGDVDAANKIFAAATAATK